jgi:hypothetical protein
MTKMMKEVDDVDAPNIYPYKACSECGDRKSCGNYNEDMRWFCEDCDDFTIRNVGECGRCGDDNNKGGTELWNDLCDDCDKHEAPKCAEEGCENHAAKNEYYPNSEGGKYWTLCEECYDNDQDDE